MIFDIIVLAVAGYLLYAKLWSPVRSKITGLQAEMTAAWNGICAQIRLRQAAGARILDLVKAVAPQHPFVQAFNQPLAEQTLQLDDVLLAASREDKFVSLLASSRQLEKAFSPLASDARWAAAQQAAAVSNQKIALLRNQYNGAVAAYNKLLETFPANIVCSVCKLEPAPLFEQQPALTEDDIPSIP